MKLLRDVLSFGSTLATAATSSTTAMVEAGSSYASEWRKDRELEIAENTLVRAKKWSQLNEAIDNAKINTKAKSEVKDKLKDFE